MQRKDFTQKVGMHQMLHSYEAWHFLRNDLAEQIVNARVSRWTDSGRNMSERLPQVPQVPRHGIRSRRIHGKMPDKKLVATTVSSREVGLKRRREGRTMSSQEYTETHNGQRDDKGTGNGGGRQKLKHADGDFPWCMRRKSEDNEAKTGENETSRGKGGSRQKLRHVDGDVPLSMRSKGEEYKDSNKKTSKTAAA